MLLAILYVVIGVHLALIITATTIVWDALVETTWSDRFRSVGVLTTLPLLVIVLYVAIKRSPGGFI